MRKRSRILLALSLVLVLGGFAWVMLRPGQPEPLYKGKPLSYWLQGYSPSQTYPPGAKLTVGPTRAEAQAAVQHLGTNAIPTLLRFLSTPEYPFETKVMQMAQRQRFIHIAYTSSWERANEANAGFADLGLDETSAVPQLIKLFERHPNMVSRQVVPAILGQIGLPAKAAVSMLIKATTDADDYVRNNAVYALGTIHSEPALTVPVLVKSLEDTNDYTRMNAARALAAFGQNARPAVPALLKLLAQERTKIVTNSGSVQNFNSIWGPGANSGAKLWISIDVVGPTIEAIKSIDPEAAPED
jgi:hypothetical protein